MIKESEIPQGPLDVGYNNAGVIPHIGMHRRGHLFYQESSYSHFWFLGIMLIAAIAVGSLPWSTEAALGLKLKYWIAGGLLWGGICGAAPYWVRNALGQVIITDPIGRTLTIRHNGAVQNILWKDILGLQVCYHEVRSNPRLNGYQLNLVWRDSRGEVQRHCLLKHAVKKFVVSLGNKYVALSHFELLDHTKDSQPEPAADAARR